MYLERVWLDIAISHLYVSVYFLFCVCHKQETVKLEHRDKIFGAYL
jgi:hypothetical protein